MPMVHMNGLWKGEGAFCAVFPSPNRASGWIDDVLKFDTPKTPFKSDSFSDIDLMKDP